jgi:hypothetical protein
VATQRNGKIGSPAKVRISDFKSTRWLHYWDSIALESRNLWFSSTCWLLSYGLTFYGMIFLKAVCIIIYYEQIMAKGRDLCKQLELFPKCSKEHHCAEKTNM